jgi:hypothetical protein
MVANLAGGSIAGIAAEAREIVEQIEGQLDR